MNGSANTLDGKQPITQVSANATHVAANTTRPRFKPDTLQAGDTPTLVGTQKPMYARNALPAIFTDKENSIFLAAILTVKNPDELRKLCGERTSLERSRLQNFESYMIITGTRPTESQNAKASYLTNDQRTKYDQLRKQRNALLSVTPETSKSTGKAWRWREVKRISKQLYELTGHHGYNYGYDT